MFPPLGSDAGAGDEHIEIDYYLGKIWVLEQLLGQQLPGSTRFETNRDVFNSALDGARFGEFEQKLTTSL
eukprot:5398620-Amphidinium_carterae.1